MQQIKGTVRMKIQTDHIATRLLCVPFICNFKPKRNQSIQKVKCIYATCFIYEQVVP